MQIQENDLLKSREELLSLLKNSSVPRLIWCYWSGGPMNGNRLRSFEMMRKYMGVPICLVTDSNIEEFVVEGYPLHDTYKYLSSVHKSDYLRIYLLHHYGGGWHDIKPTKVSYLPSWDEFDNPEIYCVGKPEIKGGPAKVFDQFGLWMPDYWTKLVATNRWVGRANTPFSQELYNEVNQFLDENSEDLKMNPAKHAYDKKKNKLFAWFSGENNRYPLPWTVFGNIFHPLNYKYRQHFKQTLPADETENLGLPYR
jgi:hypothetical protein